MPYTSAPAVVSSIASQGDADAFRALNEEWISRLFTLQKEDRAVLEDPFGRIVGPGGDVLLAREPGSGTAAGCVALLAYPDAVFELAKMAVAPAAQGRGIGRQLIAAAIDRAQALGGARLFLGTNSKLATAIHLYEEAGFVRITRNRLPVADYYARADVLMELRGRVSTSPDVSRADRRGGGSGNRTGTGPGDHGVTTLCDHLGDLCPRCHHG